MKLLEVDINDISINDYNPNSMTPSEYSNLIYSLKNFGQVVPCLCYQKDEKYVIIDGEHRFRAMKELEFKKVHIVLDEKEGDSARYKMLTIALDEFHGKINKDLVIDIFKGSDTNTKEMLDFFTRLKIEMNLDKSYFGKKFEPIDWDKDFNFQEPENIKEPFTILATKGEIDLIKSLSVNITTEDLPFLKSIFDLASSVPINEDEKAFLIFQLAARRALLATCQLHGRDKMIKPLSLVFRGTKDQLKPIYEAYCEIIKK